MLATIDIQHFWLPFKKSAELNPFIYSLAIRHCLIISYAIKLNLTQIWLQDRIGNGHGSVGVTFEGAIK